MNNTNWDEFKCRCSAISKIMADKRGFAPLTELQNKKLQDYKNKVQKAEILTQRQFDEMIELQVKEDNSRKLVLSDTCIEYLMEVYAWETEQMRPLSEQFEVKQMRKGKLAEEDAITLLSVVENTLYIKNEERIFNDYLSGIPDVFAGEEVMRASKITDIKNTWDYPIFLKKINNGLDNGNEEQVQGYMDISGAQQGEIAFTLVNMPKVMREDFKLKLFYSSVDENGNAKYATMEAPEFLKEWALAEHDMIFDKIPMHKRVYKIPIQPFTELKKQQVYDRVKACREYLWKFHEQYEKMNLHLDSTVPHRTLVV